MSARMPLFKSKYDSLPLIWSCHSPLLSLGNNPNHQQGSKCPLRSSPSLTSYPSKHKQFSSVTPAEIYHTHTSLFNFVHVILLCLIHPSSPLSTWNSCSSFQTTLKWPYLPKPPAKVNHFLLCVPSHLGTYFPFDSYQQFWNYVHVCLPIILVMLR